jgi:sugar phosphate isomerase/epimerase
MAGSVGSADHNRPRAPGARHPDAAWLPPSVIQSAPAATPSGAVITSTLGPSLPPTWEAGRDRVAEAVGRLCAVAGEFGVVLAVEPHVGSGFDGPEKARWLVRAVDHPSLKLNVDVSQFVAQGLDVGAALELLIPHAAHLHVKDVASARPLRLGRR